LAEHPLLQGRDARIDWRNDQFDPMTPVLQTAEADARTKLERRVDYCHFDEACTATRRSRIHAGAHVHGQQAPASTRQHPWCATQSPHKVLAVPVPARSSLGREQPRTDLDAEAFQTEAFSDAHIHLRRFTGIIASIDVATAMMAGDPGRSLVQETLDEARPFRRAMAARTADWLEERTQCG